MDGLRATELVLRLDHPPRVLVVTTFASDDYVLEAMRAGAAGFLLKRATADELIHAVRTVASSDHLLYPSAIRDLVRRLGRPAAYRGEPLTPRGSRFSSWCPRDSATRRSPAGLRSAWRRFAPTWPPCSASCTRGTAPTRWSSRSAPV